jgi:hypothetical protein
MGCITRLGAAGLIIVLVVLCGFAAASLVQDNHQQSHDPRSRQDAPPPGGHGEGAGGGFPDLIAGLEETPGCIGVETARTNSGKEVIFAWFENKKAALRWYYSDMHTKVMKQFFPASEGAHDALEHDPMADVPEDVPILTIASITFADRPQFEGATTLPISQIAIEMYTPVSGGVYLGGRFAPEELEVEGLENALEEDDESGE